HDALPISVLSMPAVQRLRELQPDAYIAVLCPVKLRDLWQHNPFVNEVVPFVRTPDLRTLRALEFDRAIIFPNSFRSAWECWRAGIPARVGFAGRWRRHLLTDIVPEPANEQPVRKKITVAGKKFAIKHFPVIRHQAQRYLDLIGHLGGSRELVQPRIWLAPGEL